MRRFVLLCLALVSVSGLGNDLASGAEARNKKLLVSTFFNSAFFQQQVKPKVGDQKGETLTNSVLFSVIASGGYRVWDSFGVGVFARFDSGEQRLAQFSRFEDGRTVTDVALEGKFHELWVGPEVFYEWRHLFFELGYGFFAIRMDTGRSDIPNTQSETDGLFSTNPSLAWQGAFGFQLPIVDELMFRSKVLYRFRYYNKRGGRPLIENIEHGTQDLGLFLGLSYSI